MNKITISLITLVLVFSNVVSQEMPNIFAELPLQFSDCEIARIQLKTSSEIIKKLKPERIVTDTTNTVLIYLVKQKYSEMSYDEIMIAVPGMCNEKTGEFMHVLYLDEAAPIVGGREILGSPKVDGEITFERTKNSIKVALKRRNEPLISFDAKLGEVNPMVIEVGETAGFAVKKIPSVDGSPTPALKRLNSFAVKDLKFYDSQMAEAYNLEYNPSAKHFLPDLGQYEVVSVSFMKMDFILDYGKVEFDYLKKETNVEK